MTLTVVPLFVSLQHTGLDWDELEEQAEREDREREFSEDGEDEGGSRKRKPKGGTTGGGKKARR